MGYLFGVPGLSLASLDAFGNPEQQKVRFVCDFGYSFDDKCHLGEARACQPAPKHRPKEFHGGPKGKENYENPTKDDTLILFDPTGF